MRNHNKLLVTIAVSSALYGTQVVAEETEEEVGLNVVTVTAQRRAESAQDIPISLNVLSSEQLREDAIFKIEDLQYKVPNLQMSETGISTQMYIRGVGTGNNQGFEQSVGQYIDGVYYGRQQLIRAPFLDLERVEVLRGPQSILFGKNSIAGALNMVSVKPTEDFEAKFGIQYIPDFGALESTVVVSGAIAEDVSARLAIRNYSEDGYIFNTTLNRDETARDDLAVRLSLRWTPNDNTDITLKIEKDTFDAVGRSIEVVRDDPYVAPVNLATIFASIGLPGAIEEADINFERQASGAEEEFSNNELTNITLTGDFEIGDYTLTSITGVVSYEFNENCDCDFIAVPVFDANGAEVYDQFSQEIRILSPLGDTFDWVGGFFYQTNEIDFNDSIRVPTTSILGALNPALAPILGRAASREYDSESDLWAVFFQGNWHIDEQWEMTFGIRYTSEEKTGFRELNITEIDTGNITTDPVAPLVFLAAFGIESEQSGGHSLSGSRDESSVTPLISLQYKMNDDIMFYGSAVTGFKSGGFDARANNTSSFEFEEEEATSFEFGVKTSLFDNTLEVNAAYYKTDYDNLQVSQFDGVLGFTVGNAKKTKVQGLEVDGRWLISEELTMNYSLGFLDHEFTDFADGNCYSFQAIEEPDTYNAETGLCDYSGKSGQYTPDFTSSISFQYAQPVSLGIFDYFTSNLGFYHSASQNVDVNLNPLFEMDAYTKVDIRFALEGERFSIALFGKNITNEEILTYVGNVPLSINSFGTNTFYGFVDRPAAYGIQMSYEF